VDVLHARLVENIKKQAERRGILLTHLPDRADLSRSHFWAVMKGSRSPTLGWVTKIAAALECSDPASLFVETDAAKS
jgi:hypothetical protein